MADIFIFYARLSTWHWHALTALGAQADETRRLMAVPGVGAVTAAAFMATVDEPHPVSVDTTLSKQDREEQRDGQRY